MNLWHLEQDEKEPDQWRVVRQTQGLRTTTSVGPMSKEKAETWLKALNEDEQQAGWGKRAPLCGRMWVRSGIVVQSVLDSSTVPPDDHLHVCVRPVDHVAEAVAGVRSDCRCECGDEKMPLV